jgi:hypothetical protein
LNSREENGVAIMTAADLRQELHWTGVVIGFTNGKSNNLGALHERAAGLARALGDCDRAWRHHQAAVSFNPDPARVDVESAALASCYGEKGELDRARRFLMSSGLPGPLSRGVLAEIHFAANEFQNVADVLSGVDVEAPTSGRSQVLLRLASAELQAQAGQYTQAADLYWKGFIAELLALRAKTPGTRRREWYRDVLSIDSGLPHHFKSAIDRVVPDGHERVNDWLLVYSILVGDRVGVERYFRLLAASGSQQRDTRALMDYMNELRGRVAAR